MDNKSVHQFKVKNIKGEEVSLEDYKGKVLMIVNTASKCGFTPQLTDLEELYAKYHEKGFEILAFPSNDFGAQEPLNGQEIEQFCMINYQAHYPIFDKVEVKGANATPLFRFFANKKENGSHSAQPRWNFTKYIIDKNGNFVTYYYPFTKPTASRVQKKIEELLAQ
jgi:glutathione peroxidase